MQSEFYLFKIRHERRVFSCNIDGTLILELNLGVIAAKIYQFKRDNTETSPILMKNMFCFRTL